MSTIEFFFVYETTQHMKLFDATLIGHEHECWGTSPIMPKDSATNKSLNLMNLSEKRSEARYPTGTAHGVPVLLKRGYDPKPVVMSYFTHTHRMLARLQDQVVEPVFLEFFASFESTDPEDYNNMALGWLKEFLKLKQRFDYFYIILTPYPKYKNLNTIGMFIEETNPTPGGYGARTGTSHSEITTRRGVANYTDERDCWWTSPLETTEH